MAEQQREPTLAEIDAKVAEIRSKGIGSGDAKTRTGKEKGVKRRLKLKVLTKTWRSDKFTFRCRTDLKKRIAVAAKEEGLSIAEWMEATIKTRLEPEQEGGAS